MTKKTVIVDYGLGNLHSVRHALEHVGADSVQISSNISDILQADHLILPGVGAFGNGMRELAERSLSDAIINYAKSGKPLLGICLGMQLFASSSEEFGFHTGLNLIPGKVVPIPTITNCGSTQKVPFVGWSGMKRVKDWGDSPLSSTKDHEAVYLVHSYHMMPDDSSAIMAVANYGGHDITVAVCKDNIIGFQFHPEKSGRIGLSILRSFLDI